MGASGSAPGAGEDGRSKAACSASADAGAEIGGSDDRGTALQLARQRPRRPRGAEASGQVPVSLPEMSMFIGEVSAAPGAVSSKTFVTVSLDGKALPCVRYRQLPCGPVRLPAGKTGASLHFSFSGGVSARLSIPVGLLGEYGAPLYSSLWLGLPSEDSGDGDASLDVEDAMLAAGDFGTPKVRITLFKPSGSDEPYSGLAGSHASTPRLVRALRQPSFWERDLFADPAHSSLEFKVAQVQGLMRCVDETNEVVATLLESGRAQMVALEQRLDDKCFQLLPEDVKRFSRRLEDRQQELDRRDKELQETLELKLARLRAGHERELESLQREVERQRCRRLRALEANAALLLAGDTGKALLRALFGEWVNVCRRVHDKAAAAAAAAAARKRLERQLERSLGAAGVALVGGKSSALKALVFSGWSRRSRAACSKEAGLQRAARCLAGGDTAVVLGFVFGAWRDLLRTASVAAVAAAELEARCEHARLREALEASRTECATLHDLSVGKAKALRELESELREREKAASLLREAHGRSREALTGLERELSERERSTSLLREENVASERLQAKALHNQTERSDEELRHYARELQSQQNLRHRLETELSSRGQELQALQQRCDQEVIESKRARRELELELERNKRSAGEDLRSRLASVEEDAQRRCAQSSLQNEALEERCAQWQAELLQTGEALASLMGRRKAHNEQQMSRHSDVIRRNREDLEMHEQQKRTFKETLLLKDQDLKKASQDARSEASRAKMLQAEVTALEGSARASRALENEVDVHQASLRHVEAEARQGEARAHDEARHAEELAALRSQALQTLGEEQSVLSQLAEQQQKELTSALEQLTRSRESLQELERQRAGSASQAVAERDEARLELGRLGASHADELSRMREGLVQHAREVASAKAVALRLEDEASSRSQDLERLRSEAAASGTSAADACRALELSRTELEALKTELRSGEEDVDEARKQLKTLATEVQSARTTAALLEEEVRRHETALEDRAGQMKLQAVDAARARLDLERAELGDANSKSALEEAKRDMELLRADHAKQLAAMQLSLAKSAQEAGALRAELASIREAANCHEARAADSERVLELRGSDHAQQLSALRQGLAQQAFEATHEQHMALRLEGELDAWKAELISERKRQTAQRSLDEDLSRAEIATHAEARAELEKRLSSVQESLDIMGAEHARETAALRLDVARRSQEASATRSELQDAAAGAKDHEARAALVEGALQQHVESKVQLLSELHQHLTGSDLASGDGARAAPATLFAAAQALREEVDTARDEARALVDEAAKREEMVAVAYRDRELRDAQHAQQLATLQLNLWRNSQESASSQSEIQLLREEADEVVVLRNKLQEASVRSRGAFREIDALARENRERASELRCLQDKADAASHTAAGQFKDAENTALNIYKEMSLKLCASEVQSNKLEEELKQVSVEQRSTQENGERWAEVLFDEANSLRKSLQEARAEFKAEAEAAAAAKVVQLDFERRHRVRAEAEEAAARASPVAKPVGRPVLCVNSADAAGSAAVAMAAAAASASAAARAREAQAETLARQAREAREQAAEDAARAASAAASGAGGDHFGGATQAAAEECSSELERLKSEQEILHRELELARARAPRLSVRSPAGGAGAATRGSSGGSSPSTPGNSARLPAGAGAGAGGLNSRGSSGSFPPGASARGRGQDPAVGTRRHLTKVPLRSDPALSHRSTGSSADSLLAESPPRIQWSSHLSPVKDR